MSYKSGKPNATLDTETLLRRSQELIAENQRLIARTEASIETSRRLLEDLAQYATTQKEPRTANDS